MLPHSQTPYTAPDDDDDVELGRHSEVKLLHRRLRSLGKIFRDGKRSIASARGTSFHHEYQKAYPSHRNTLRGHEEAFLKEFRARYKVKQPVIDIQRQLKGLPLANKRGMKAEYFFVERAGAIETLFTFATESPEGERQRRDAAISVLTTLYRLQESRSFPPLKKFWLHVQAWIGERANRPRGQCK